MGFLGGLRVRLLLVVALALLPTFALALYEAREERREARREAETTALRIAHTTNASLRETFESTRQLLAIAAALPEVTARRPNDCSRLLAEFHTQRTRYTNIGAVDVNGDVFCTAVPLAARTNLADRHYIRRVLQTGGFTISDYQIGRITGRASINFGHPIHHAERLVGVAFAAIDLGWLSTVTAEAELPAGTTVTLVDRNGVVLLRHPEEAGFVGRQVRHAPAFQGLFEHGAPLVVAAPGLDSVPRLYAFVPLRTDGAVTAAYLGIGIPEATAYREADRRLGRAMALLGGIALLALGAGHLAAERMVSRPVRALLHAARTIATGDLTTRANLRQGGTELQALGDAFDEMAASLHQHVEALQASERLRSEMELARGIQRSLLPATPPRVPGLSLAATCRPSSFVGGDYYDILALGGGRYAVVVADVSGHGASSALVMATFRSTLYAITRTSSAPATVLDELNTVLVRDLGDSGMFVTCFLAVYHAGTGDLVYSSAGHPPALLLTHDKGAEPLEPLGGVLGLFTEQRWSQQTCALDPGAALVVYTDGVTDVRAPNGELFGEHRLVRIVEAGVGLPASGLERAVLESLDDHANGREPDDDITVLVAVREDRQPDR